MSLLSIPTELQLHIMDLLSVPELLRLSKTCCCLQEVASDPSLWKNFTHIDVGKSQELENDEFIQLISKCPKLKYANFEDTLIEDSALERLANDCSELEHVNLSDCNEISLYGGVEILLEKALKMKILDIRGCDFDGCDPWYIGEMIELYPHVNILHEEQP